MRIGPLPTSIKAGFRRGDRVMPGSALLDIAAQLPAVEPAFLPAAGRAALLKLGRAVTRYAILILGRALLAAPGADRLKRGA